jgi:hypothetical protein
MARNIPSYPEYYKTPPGGSARIIEEMHRSNVVNKNKEGRPVAKKGKGGAKSGNKNQFGPSGGRIISK